MTTQHSETEITKMIISYKKRQLRDRKKYEKKKDDQEFIIKNRARAKAHYLANKELKKQKYQDNKELLNCRSLFHYYKYHSRENDFIEKYPDKCEIMRSHGFIIDSGSGSSSG